MRFGRFCFSIGYIGGLLILAASAVAGETDKAVCYTIVDRYQALLKADPEAPHRDHVSATTPVGLLAQIASSGVTIEPEILLEHFNTDPKDAVTALLPKQTPAIRLSKEVTDGFVSFTNYAVRFSRIESKNLFRLSSIQGTAHCYNDIFFTLKNGSADEIATPEGGFGECGVAQDIGTIDGAAFLFIESASPNDGTSDSTLIGWDGTMFSPACTIHVDYAPRFTLHALFHERDERCQHSNCDALQQAAFELVKAVRANPDEEKSLFEKLSPLLRADFVSLKEKSKAAGGEPEDYGPETTDVHPLLLPLVVNDKAYLARVGHFTVGWRVFSDWSVIVEEPNKDTVSEVARFAFGMTNGALLKATVQ